MPVHEGYFNASDKVEALPDKFEAFPAIRFSSLTESVQGKDERVQVAPMTSNPYKWICLVEITDSQGTRGRGSGFAINLNFGKTVVVTSGHCVYSNGQYHESITVTFPGKAAVTVDTSSLWASNKWRESSSADHDYGLINLPWRSNEGFGWAVLSDDDLSDRLVTNCGYPGDKPRGTMWITGGAIKSVTTNRIFYMNDTAAGQSGSPVYTWYKGYWTVVGVHSYGGEENSAPRFTDAMTQDIIQNMDYGVCLKSYKSWPNRYLRMVNHTVNCQYTPPKTRERFTIAPTEIPTKMPPSGVQSTSTVTIESEDYKGWYMSLDSKGGDSVHGHGFGSVNGVENPENKPEFKIRREVNGSIQIESIAYPKCYIRMDGGGIKRWRKYGGGQVNCQWGASDWETFSMTG